MIFDTEQLGQEKGINGYNGGKSCIDRAYSGIASIVFLFPLGILFFGIMIVADIFCSGS